MNKLYLGDVAIVDLSGYYNKAAIDASYGEVEGQIDSLTDTVGGLDASLSALVTQVATDYYTKTQIDASVAALEQEIEAAIGIDMVAVETLPTASADTLRKIYLVPSASAQTSNSKDEYVTLDKGASADPRYVWEKIGSTEVDLSNYYTKSDVDAIVTDVSTDLWTEVATLAKKADVDASIASINGSIGTLNSSVSGIEADYVKSSNNTVSNVISLTSAQYAALDTKQATTMYVVTD